VQTVLTGQLDQLALLVMMVQRAQQVLLVIPVALVQLGLLVQLV
jgi:hypothetical protein